VILCLREDRYCSNPIEVSMASIVSKLYTHVLCSMLCITPSSATLYLYVIIVLSPILLISQFLSFFVFVKTASIKQSATLVAQVNSNFLNRDFCSISSILTSYSCMTSKSNKLKIIALDPLLLVVVYILIDQRLLG